MAPTAQLQELLDRLYRGEESSRNALLQHSLDRFQQLAKRMFRRNDNLRVLYQTDDVLSGALIRLNRILTEVRPPNVRAFMGLAATQIRWVLRDLAREAAKNGGLDYPGEVTEPLDCRGEPSDLAEWSEFHQKIEALPDEERETFDLLVYEGLSQDEAAVMLGVSVRTVKRRWARARLMLHDAMHGQWPSLEDAHNA